MNTLWVAGSGHTVVCVYSTGAALISHRTRALKGIHTVCTCGAVETNTDVSSRFSSGILIDGGFRADQNNTVINVLLAEGSCPSGRAAALIHDASIARSTVLTQTSIARSVRPIHHVWRLAADTSTVAGVVQASAVIALTGIIG